MNERSRKMWGQVGNYLILINARKRVDATVIAARDKVKRHGKREKERDSVLKRSAYQEEKEITTLFLNLHNYIKEEDEEEADGWVNKNDQLGRVYRS